ncbi:MAG: tetratricopeptide repeat protein [candidate division NC10 bacterium]|nr:tetratricopeptide repeat protein [candidate division NC10 bacterium]
MTCHEACDAFSDLYDNALSGAPLVTITQHLASCPECRAEWAAFRKAMQAVSDLGGAEPSPGFAVRVRQRIEAPTRWQRSVHWLFFPLRVKVPIQALALVLVAFAGLLLYQRSPELRRAAEPQPAAPPPVAREAPAPAAPPGAAEPLQKMEGATPSAEPPKADQIERPAAPADAVTPSPRASLEAEKEHAASALRDEAKEVGKTAAPSESPKAVEPSLEPGAKSPESGVAGGRLRQSAPAPAQSPTRAKEGSVSSIPPKSADELYAAALADTNSQRYDRAIDGLRAFMAQNPRDPRIPDARLRLADAYVAQRRYTEAIAEYAALAREFPDSPLIPTALYRQAQAVLATGDHAGCRMLQDVADRYPQAPEAALAREILSTRCR